MAQRTVNLPGIGDILLAKRRGAKNIRISIQADGSVRVGLPAWAPYAAGISFALTRAEWITTHRTARAKLVLENEARVGKSYRLNFVNEAGLTTIRSRVSGSTIMVTSSLPYTSEKVQSAAAKACERALKLEAEKLLKIRLDELALKHSFYYKSLRIKRLRSRWGSCSADNVITLNYYLLQLPWPLIDYVIIHELVHTKHHDHSPDFWKTFGKVLPDVKTMRKEIKAYRPALMLS